MNPTTIYKWFEVIWIIVAVASFFCFVVGDWQSFKRKRAVLGMIVMIAVWPITLAVLLVIALVRITIDAAKEIRKLPW